MLGLRWDLRWDSPANAERGMYLLCGGMGWGWEGKVGGLR